ncbi:MAG: carboxyltransferase domain-containing protein, partial [Sphingobacteriales bacterium]
MFIMAITIIFDSFKAMDSNPIQISAGDKSTLNIYYLSERAVTIAFGTTINEDTLQHVSRFNELVTQNPFPGFCTAVPAYTTLSVFFDPMQVFRSALPGRDCFAKVSGYLKRLKDVAVMDRTDTHDTITIPVCYGGEFGPDLHEVAEMHDLT